MNSRERVLTTLAHQAPDCVPIDYAANPGIDVRLKHHFGLHADDDEGLRQALGVDLRVVAAPYVGRPLHVEPPDRRVDMWGIHSRWIEHEAGGYWDFCDFPLRAALYDEIEAWPMPSPDDFAYESVADQCRQWSDYCLVLGDPGHVDIMNSTGMIRSVEKTLIDLASSDPACLRYIDRRLDIQFEIVRRSLEAAQGRIDLLWIGEDLGTQRGPLISRTLFRRHLRPRHQRFVDLAASYRIPVMMHSCGSSSWAFPDFIEMGVGVVDTLQPEAKDMAPAYLKKRFGRELAFHGCISTAGPVAVGSVEDTVQNVRETLEIMMPGGGYIFSPTHMLQDNSPTENVLALYAAARRYGRYSR